MYMYCRMYMKIQYLQFVVVRVTVDKVSWGMQGEICNLHVK